MNVTFPPVPATYDAGYFNRAFATFSQAANRSVTRFEAVDGILLQAPDGSVWRVTVSNTGTLTAAAVPLGQQGSPPY
jgi:hypothetical protein